MANFTREAILAAFLKIAEKKPLEKISVRDIVDECGINRNTFYYHFQDIYAVLEEVLVNQILITESDGNSPHYLVDVTNQTIIQMLHPMEDRKYALSPYLGDFLVTTYSQYSRNRNFGIMVGKGYSVQTVLMEMKMVAEGYSAVSSVYHFNQEQLHADLPILTTTYKILYEKAPVRTSIHRLLDQLK